MEEKIKIINNCNHGHFRLEERDNHLIVIKELRYRWEYGLDGRVLSVADLRTGHTAALLG